MINTKKGAVPENKPVKKKSKYLTVEEKRLAEARKIEENDMTSESDTNSSSDEKPIEVDQKYVGNK